MKKMVFFLYQSCPNKAQTYLVFAQILINVNIVFFFCCTYAIVTMVWSGVLLYLDFPVCSSIICFHNANMINRDCWICLFWIC